MSNEGNKKNNSAKRKRNRSDYHYKERRRGGKSRRRQRTRSYINDVVRFMLVHLHILSAMIGFGCIAFGIYVLVTNWNTSIQTDFFRAAGIMVVLFGIIVVMIAHMGFQGIWQQSRHYGFWTGRKVGFTYQIILTAMMACELYFLSAALGILTRFKSISSSLKTGQHPEYVATEGQIANIFNSLFFSAVNICDVNNQIYDYLWTWITDHCPTSLSLNSCRACASYSITMCSADLTSCNGDPGDSNNAACPYNICRENLLTYFINEISPVSYSLLALLCFQALIFVLSLMLVCYTPRDGVEAILAKNGLQVSQTITSSMQRDGQYRTLTTNTRSESNDDKEDSESDDVSSDEGEQLVDVEKEEQRGDPPKTSSGAQSSPFLMGVISSLKPNSSKKDKPRLWSASTESIRYDAIYLGNRLSDMATGRNFNVDPPSSASKSISNANKERDRRKSPQPVTPHAVVHSGSISRSKQQHQHHHHALPEDTKNIRNKDRSKDQDELFALL